MRSAIQPKPGRRLRAVHIGPDDVVVDRRPDGTTYVRSPHPLGHYPEKLTERLEHWAQHAADRPFLAQRGSDGSWQRLTYAQTLSRVRRLAQALIDRQLSPDRRLAIVSGNSLNHACLALAAIYIGVPYTPISPAYSLVAKRYEALQQIFHVFRPSLVFADDGGAFGPALRHVMTTDMQLVVGSSEPESLPSTRLAELEETSPTPAIDEAHRRVTADTIAKVLFTSGSTGRPKGVINTHRMLCSNQQMVRSRLACLADEPPVLCDWLPWNHTFGGNHNMGITLYNGGTLYIDEGRPLPGAFETTVRNLREIATSVYFNVPKGYELLVPWLRADAELRRRFFSRVKLLFFAAAGLTQHVWDALQDLAVESCGEEILMITGLGATESAPAALFTGRQGAASGWVGQPLPGVELKLAPVGEKIEARLRGPSITPGYWDDGDRTAAVFDAEGFYCLGDAVRWIDPVDPQLGLCFDGRLNEDFKLSSGTWVSVGPLRAKFLLHFGALVQDVVIVGPDRAFITALVFPNLDACRERCSTPATELSPAQLLEDPYVLSEFQRLLEDLASVDSGSSRRIVRARLLDQPPTLDAGELTDKGSVNQEAVMRHRTAAIDELYAVTPSARVITIGNR